MNNPINKTFLFLIIGLFNLSNTFSQQTYSLDGFWESSITYECSWGWKDERNSVLLSKNFGDSYKGMVFGGEIEISYSFSDEYRFEITGQSGCIRKGTLKKTEFAGRIYLRGEWVPSGGNNAMWGTGLCCNGRIELYRDKAKEKPKEKSKEHLKEEKSENTTSTHSHIKLEAGKKFILKSVLFKLSSDELLPEAYPELDFLITVLKEDVKRVIRLEGHTDIDGPHRQNKKLSKKRVKQVKRYLVEKGIEEHRIKLKWYGDKKPLLKNGDVEKRKINRRVEVRVLK